MVSHVSFLIVLNAGGLHPFQLWPNDALQNREREVSRVKQRLHRYTNLSLKSKLRMRI